MEDKLVNTRLQELNPQYLDFIESGFIETAAEAFAAGAGLIGRNIEILQNSFFLYLIFFLDETRIIEFISDNCGLLREEAQEIFYAFSASLPEGLNEMIKSEYTRINGAEISSDLVSEIAETENALRSIEGLRTMAGDASAVVQAPVNTYQSSQAEILTRPEEPDVPTPTVLPPTSPTNNPARWGSEQ